MLRVTDLAHIVVRQHLAPGDTAIDATVGNGHDTVMLADAVGPAGHVYGFDVQVAALDEARRRLATRSQVTLFQQGHEHMAASLPPALQGRVAAVMFNLGYLPGGDKGLVTRTETTLAAIGQATILVAPRGLLTVVLYTGHPGGAEEAAAVRAALAQVSENFAVHAVSREHAAAPAPALLIVQKLR